MNGVGSQGFVPEMGTRHSTVCRFPDTGLSRAQGKWKIFLSGRVPGKPPLAESNPLREALSYHI